MPMVKLVRKAARFLRTGYLEGTGACTLPDGEPTGGRAASPEPPASQHYRTVLANERTFLGWQGIALGLIFSAIVIHSAPAIGASRAYWVLAIVLAATGFVVAGASLLRWTRVDRAIRSTPTR